LKLHTGHSWKDTASFDASADRGAAVWGMDADGKSLIRTTHDSSGRAILVRRDMASGSESPLFSDPVYDVGDAVEDPWTRRIIGASYSAAKTEFHYFDPSREALQKGLEAAFPGLSVDAVSFDLAKDKVIAAVDGPRRPLAYYLLDRTTHQATLFGAAYPNLKETDLGEMKPYPYTARDGLAIPAYVTLPPGKTPKNLPTIVMPHGGPDARDEIRFDWWAQFLASRGYVVLQPNFRGSFGFGHKFTEAGLQQWGLKMQDDITDGVKKLLADGIADPKRVCIVGASYGGYAALAGATFTPDLYACAVSVAGISDLPKMMQRERARYGKHSGVVSFWISRIGSPYDDSDRLRAASPARHADLVKCPVLLMHGDKDSSVLIEQSEIMADALTRAGKDVTFVKLEGDDHSLELGATRIKMLSELERFLKSHIGS
jgi:dipeptidyl aminopeptidase/acylaminoacyl peptidase